MKLQLATASWTQADGDWLIIAVPESFELAGPVAVLDDALRGQISRLRESQDFTGKAAETLALPGVSGIGAKRLLLVGLGPADKLAGAGLFKALMTAARTVSTKKTERIAVALPSATADLPFARVLQIAATAMTVGCVGQDLYRAEKKRVAFESVDLLVDAGQNLAELAPAAESGTILGEAVNLARELVNKPARVIYPASFAERAQALARQYSLRCEVLDQPALEAEKMGSLLAVSAGSEQPPRLVFLEYNAAAKGAPVLALVGKGVTFDSGGLSIKPNDSM